MNNRSIARRIFQIIFAGNLIVLFVVMSSAWWSLETLEQTLIDSEKQAEVGHFEKYGDKSKLSKMQTAQMINVYIPNEMQKSIELPLVFANLPIPYEGEVESIGGDFLVLIHAFPEGTYYVAKSLRAFEIQEEKAVFFAIVLAGVVAVLSFLLALMASRLIARPIEEISTDIQSLDTSNMNSRIQQKFTDKELNTIALAINEQLDNIEEVFKRERAMTAMASHELRTPIAVILGAANVIENRQQLLKNDQVTLKRIITTANDMTNIIQALLDLVRRTKCAPLTEPVRMRNLLEQLEQEYNFHSANIAERLNIEYQEYNVELLTDPVLVKVMLQNIINNALNYTTGKINIILDDLTIQIVDEGIGNSKVKSNEFDKSTGLGLYIVSLICNYLKWHYEITANKNAGTKVTLFFKEGIKNTV